MNDQPPLVLVVDDDQDFLEMTRAVLETGGYRVACALDRKAALKILVSDRPHLVITDLMMQSKGAGFLLSQKIKETSPCHDVPVIIMTAAGSRVGYDFAPRNAGELAAMHAGAFIEKPWSPEDLLAKVADLLGNKRKEVRS